MKKTMRAISFVLATLLALSALAACGGREKMPEKQVVDHVYKYNQTKLVTVEEPDWSNEEEFQGYTYLSNNSLGKNGYCYVLQSVNKDYETTSTVAHIGTYGSEEVKEIPSICRMMNSIILIWIICWCWTTVLLYLFKQVR